MTWFKVDDTLAFHAKAIAAGNAAMGLWVRAGSWSAQQLTDGFIPAHVAAALGTPEEAAALVQVSLWDMGDTGFQFHQWTDADRQPLREDVERRREAWRQKKRAQRARNGANQPRNEAGEFMSPGDSPGESQGESQGVSPVSRPVPSRPYYLPSRESLTSGSGDDFAPPPEDPIQLETRAPRAKSLDRWKVSQTCRNLALGKGLDLDDERARFVANAKANGRTAADWDAAFEGWLLESARRRAGEKPRAGSSVWENDVTGAGQR